MPSHRTPTEFGVGSAATPLGATLRDRWRTLVGTFLAATLVAFAVDWAAGVDAITVVAVLREPPALGLLSLSPLDQLVLRLERASLVGLLSVAVTFPLVAARDDDDVRLRPGATAFLLAFVGGVLGAGAGHAVGVDAVRALVTSGLVDDTATGGRFWLAELAVSVPVTVAVAVALPGAVVGAVRSGLVRTPPSSRQRWLAVLVSLSFVSVYSPSDSVTFVLGAVAVLAGLVAGLALVEFDVVSTDG